MIKTSRAIVVVAVGFLILLALVASFVAGYAKGRQNFNAATFARQIVTRVLGLSSPSPVSSETGRSKHQYESVFLTLEGESIRLPVGRSGQGGGLTSFGDEVLVLTHEGRLFSARDARQFTELAIELPNNGFNAFRRAAESDQFADLEFAVHWLRYNDILHYRSPTGSGLAVCYTEYFEDDACYRTTIAVLDIDVDVLSAEEIAANAEDWRILFRTDPCLPLKKEYRVLEGHMAGGRMAFQEPSTLYLSSGDYGWDGVYAPEAIARRPEWDYGKVIAIDVLSDEARTISVGHRNSQGITLDQEGRLWVVEHGPRGGDELNRIIEENDYGWPSETLGTMYSGFPWPNTISYGRHETFTAPVLAWLPSVAPSGLDLIEGFHPTWDGDLIMATLRDQSLYRLRIVGDRVKFAERIHIGRRIRYVLQHNDGRLVLWTDSNDFIFVTVTEGGAEMRLVEALISDSGYTEAEAQRVRDAFEACLQCHELGRDAHSMAPSLSSIYGEPIAGTTFAGYSEALREHGGRWTDENLLAYLQDPQFFAPGTTMPKPGYNDPAVLNTIIELMAALRNPSATAQKEPSPAP